MNLQAERIDAYCRQLRLDGLAERFEAITGQAAEQDWRFLEFLEQALAQAGGRLRLRHRLQSLKPVSGGWKLEGVVAGQRPFVLEAEQVVNTLPPQLLPMRPPLTTLPPTPEAPPHGRG